jgi:hypothetical protein
VDWAPAGPVLPLDGKGIGWRSDRDAVRKRACMRPSFCAVRRRADRKIAVKTDLQASVSRAARGSLKLAVGKPLAEEGELKAYTVALDRMIDGLGITVPQILWPGSPVPAKVSLGRRLEGGETAHVLAAGSRECVVVGNEWIAWPRGTEAQKGCAPRLKRRVLGKPYLFVFDRFRRRCGREPGR